MSGGAAAADAVDTRGASYRALFAVPGFPLLAAASLLVRTAAGMWQLALVLFVIDRLQSPVLAGLAVFLSIAPGMVLSPLAGALLDRHGRVRLMGLDYAASAIAIGGEGLTPDPAECMNHEESTFPWIEVSPEHG